MGKWNLKFYSNIDGLLIVKESTIELTNNDATSFVLGAKLIRSSENIVSVGFGQQSEIVFDKLDLDIKLLAINSGWEFEALANAKGKIKIDSANGDSFLSKVTKGKGINGDFDIDIGYSTERGFYLGLGAGLSTVVHLDKTLLNFIKIGDMPIALDITEEGLSLVAGADVEVNFKNKFIFTLDNMGLRTAIDFTAPQKNIGFGDLSFKFKRPSGIGIGIDAKKVQGRGYLYIDEINESYKGYLFLKIGKISISAIGKLQTKLPGNDDGYSFLGLVSATLPKPLHIVFGFYLLKVGGLIALHRDMNTTVLRDSVRTGALDNILFPEITFENIDTTFDSVLSGLEEAFPVQEGRHSFALMGKFNYMKKSIVTLDLAFLVSVPAPMVFGLAGVCHVRKGESGDKININAAFIAIIDFGEKLFSLDVSIYNSTVSGMAISGDFAARFGWGDENRGFIISAGGFHPAYEVSDVYKIGSMKRFLLVIRNTPVFKLNAYFYVAITSNTFQVGAGADLFAKMGPFSLAAYFRFDALFNFDPFYFLVNIGMGVGLKKGNKTLFTINLDLEVKGPKAYHINGTADFKILGVSKEFKIDKTFGDDENEQVEPVDVYPILLEEFNKNISWNTVEPVGKETITFVALDETDEALILNAFGTLRVNQQIVPLDLPMNVYGEKPIVGYNLFRITGLRINANTTSSQLVSTKETEDYFAPAQYVRLDDREKLKSKSFELQSNGVEILTDEFGLRSAQLVTFRVLEYEEKYREALIPVGYDDERAKLMAYEGRGNLGKIIASKVTTNITLEDFEGSIEGGAIGKSNSYRIVKRKKTRKNKVRIKPVEYTVVSRDTLKDSDIVTTHSRTKAELILRNNSFTDKGNNNQLIVTNHVLATAQETLVAAEI